MKLTVVIPSVGRPDSLAKALAALRSSGDGIDEIIVVSQEQDQKTQAVAEQFTCKLVRVDQPGLAWAMKQGALSAEGEVVAFTDDDAEVRVGWARTLLGHYGPNVGGVGGRDYIEASEERKMPRSHAKVGQIGILGQVYGGHHLATGATRSVAHLKGVNCSFRRELFNSLDFEKFVFGKGAQTRNEFVASLGVTSLGYSLIFDPELIVDHFPAPRTAGEKRNGTVEKIFEAAFNERLGFVLYSSKRRIRNALYLALIGYRHAPGLARLMRGATLREVLEVWRAVLAASNLKPSDGETYVAAGGAL